LILAKLGALGDRPFYVRSHYVFCSGTGWALPQWGSGNVYHEDEQGTPTYDFSIVDRVYDSIVGNGHHPIVEFGFTPLALVSDRAQASFQLEQSPSQFPPYEAGLWAYPPKDETKWSELIRSFAQHNLDRYGLLEVQQWLWELWNEPDIGYWRGTRDEYFSLYDVTVRALRSVLRDAKVGGPATIGLSGIDYLDAFLEHCAKSGTPLDFVSFHTKGADFKGAAGTPWSWRTYAPIGAPPLRQESPSMLKMLREVEGALLAISGHNQFRDLPCVLDECDASVPANMGMFDNPNFRYRNSHYFAVFQCKLMKKLLDLSEATAVGIDQATTGSFYFPGERCFEGTRSLVTYGNIEKPVLNAYRMLAKLARERVLVRSDLAWPIEQLHESDSHMPEEVDALAAIDENRLTVMVWRHADDQYVEEATPRDVEVQILGMPSEWRSLRVCHWRVDARRSNSHTAWLGLGAPDYPSDEDIASIKDREGLERVQPDRKALANDGGLSVRVELPLPSVSLFEFIPLDGSA
jgi:xylan 1,4-beta-xylosidase